MSEVAKYSMELEWKREILSGEGTEESPYVYGDEFNVDVNAFTEFAKAQDEGNCTGCSANSKLIVHFLEEPSEEVKEAIQDKWDEIDPEHEMAESYQSQEDLAEAKAVLKQSAINKMVAMGLTAEEIEALRS